MRFPPLLFRLLIFSSTPVLSTPAVVLTKLLLDEKGVDEPGTHQPAVCLFISGGRSERESFTLAHLHRHTEKQTFWMEAWTPIHVYILGHSKLITCFSSPPLGEST